VTFPPTSNFARPWMICHSPISYLHFQWFWIKVIFHEMNHQLFVCIFFSKNYFQRKWTTRQVLALTFFTVWFNKYHLVGYGHGPYVTVIDVHVCGIWYMACTGINLLGSWLLCMMGCDLWPELFRVGPSACLDGVASRKCIEYG